MVFLRLTDNLQMVLEVCRRGINGETTDKRFIHEKQPACCGGVFSLKTSTLM